MADQLTFATEAAAIAGQKQIWINQIKQRVSQGNNLVGDGSNHYTDLSGLTNDQVSQLKIYSRRNGDNDVNPSLPATTGYATPRKAYQIEKWFFLKPSIELMEDVINFTVEPYNLNWDE